MGVNLGGFDMTNENQIQKKLVSIALDILDLCYPVSEKMIYKYLDDSLMNNETELVLKHAKLQITQCKFEMSDDILIIVNKVRETIVLLEMLRQSRLLSEADITPVVVECNELLNLIQDHHHIN